MKKTLSTSLIVMILVFSLGLCAYANLPKPILIDDFEDSNMTKNPNWWTFKDDDIEFNLNILTAKKFKIKELGKYYLDINGYAKNWYVGGFGMYLAQPADKYSHVQIDIYGAGDNSGKLKIELYDDDNNNTTLEQNIAMNYAPVKDDKVSYEMNIDWKGWRQVLVPFEEFEDVNPKVGNDKWDPDDKEGSGGLLHVQFIAIANSATGNIKFKMDNIRIVKYIEPVESETETGEDEEIAD
ncbi:glycan-binding surface protein [Candidatus Margulisiibacteriota bacterium]